MVYHVPMRPGVAGRGANPESSLEGLKVKVELKVNGEKVAVNPFVSDLIANVVLTMVSTLKGVSKPEKVDLKISAGE